jgi:hypothetical protein
MKRFFPLLVLLLLTGVLANCGDKNNDLLLLPAADGYSGENFLSWTGFDDPDREFMLVRVDGKTGAITNIGGFNFFTALVYGPDGTLYGISDELHSINPQDGSTTLIGTLLYSATPVLMTGAAFSPNGTLYVLENSSPNRVFTVNLTNAALTYIGTPAALIRDFKFAPMGTLYGAFADLFVLDPSDLSTAATVGSMDKFLSELTFDSTGTLYGMDVYPSTNIYAVDLSTAATTTILPVGSIGLASFVAERPSDPGQSVLNKSAGMNGLSVPRSRETLLRLAKEIQSGI